MWAGGNSSTFSDFLSKRRDFPHGERENNKNQKESLTPVLVSVAGYSRSGTVSRSLAPGRASVCDVRTRALCSSRLRVSWGCVLLKERVTDLSQPVVSLLFSGLFECPSANHLNIPVQAHSPVSSESSSIGPSLHRVFHVFRVTSKIWWARSYFLQRRGSTRSLLVTAQGVYRGTSSIIRSCTCSHRKMDSVV